MAEALAWQLVGRASLVPDDWRDRLAARLGQRPRRLGLHAELALYGALEAMAAAGETRLPPPTLLRVASERGPVGAVAAVLAQAREGLPMPFAFLQAQPSQMLAALAAALDWQGDASFVVTQDPLALLVLAACQAGGRGMLLGWVDEAPARSEWLRFAPGEAPLREFVPLAGLAQLRADGPRWLRLEQGRLSVA